MVIPRTNGLHYDIATSPFTPFYDSFGFPYFEQFLWHICIWLFISSCMSCSLSSSTLIQEGGFGLGYSLATSMGGPRCSFPAVVFVQFTGLCFSGMSLHANQSRRPAACFLLQSYISAGFRGETGQKAEKQKGGGAERQRNTSALPSKPSCSCIPVGICES